MSIICGGDLLACYLSLPQALKGSFLLSVIMLLGLVIDPLDGFACRFESLQCNAISLGINFKFASLAGIIALVPSTLSACFHLFCAHHLIFTCERMT